MTKNIVQILLIDYGINVDIFIKLNDLKEIISETSCAAIIVIG